MSGDLALPGDIPGLLRRCSPVVWLDDEDAERWTVSGVDGPTAWAGCPAGFVEAPIDRLHLDLTDATGRAHAAWWLERWLLDDETRGEPSYAILTSPERIKLRILIQQGREPYRDVGAELRRVVLHVAGRS